MRRLAGAALAILIAGCQPRPSMVSTPSASPPGPVSPAATTAVSPSASLAADLRTVTTGSVTWTRATEPGSCGVTTALVRRAGVVLAICEDFRVNRIEVLTSADGRSWTVSDPIGLTPQSSQDVLLINGLAEEPDGTLVAVGAEALGDISRGDAATWMSTDGRRWQRGPMTASMSDAEMLAILETDDGFIAVGDDGFPGASTQLPSLRGGAVWRSSDGQHWQRTPKPQGAAMRQMAGIIATRSGWVAYGDAAPPGSGVVWTSLDGSTWKLANAPAGGSWGPIARVVNVDGRLIGVGTWTTVENTGSEVTTYGIWGSADDGRSWTILPSSIDVTIDGLWDATTVNGAVVATGGNGVVVTSPDAGATWSWRPSDPSAWLATLRPLVVFHGEIIGFATEPSDSQATFDIWVGIP